MAVKNVIIESSVVETQQFLLFSIVAICMWPVTVKPTQVFTWCLIISSDSIEVCVSLTDFRRIRQYHIPQKFVRWKPN